MIRRFVEKEHESFFYIDFREGMHVPVEHSIRAFNALADEADRISEADIAFIEANAKIPEAKDWRETF